jgi:hypothetical protein
LRYSVTLPVVTLWLAFDNSLSPGHHSLGETNRFLVFFFGHRFKGPRITSLKSIAG